MKGPLERAARALCELAGNPPGATMDGKPLWMDYLPEVRAVVEALREPSVDMTIVGGNRKHLGSGDMWRAMIDRMLEEGK